MWPIFITDYRNDIPADYVFYLLVLILSDEVFVMVNLIKPLKPGSHLPKKIIFICFNESLSKMMKNAFYFILKAFFVFKVFKFLSWLFGPVEKSPYLERKG